MRVGQIALAATIAALCACGRSEPQDAVQPANNAEPQAPPQTVPVPAPPPVAPAAPAPPVTPAPKSSLPEPKGPIDPKSVEAAGQVVQSYGALIEQKRWAEANALWGDAGAAAKFQAEQLTGNTDNHLEIGDLGEPEGAAGSIYVTMPVTFYGTKADGRPYRKARAVILRRVNDVPGSTKAQRRWHIERIDVQPS